MVVSNGAPDNLRVERTSGNSARTGRLPLAGQVNDRRTAGR
jgi:hypothetical protein